MMIIIIIIIIMFWWTDGSKDAADILFVDITDCIEMLFFLTSLLLQCILENQQGHCKPCFIGQVNLPQYLYSFTMKKVYLMCQEECCLSLYLIDSYRELYNYLIQNDNNTQVQFHTLRYIKDSTITPTNNDRLTTCLVQNMETVLTCCSQHVLL